MRLIFILFLMFVFFYLLKGQNLINNSSFEEGATSNSCNCPIGFICFNDAGRVTDGIHPLYQVGFKGCVADSLNYTNPLGALAGSNYVYFYAGGDYVEISKPINFTIETKVEICVWYAGPRDRGESGQNSSSAHFSFMADGQLIGMKSSVPVNSGWERYCITYNVSPGDHYFGIHSGGSDLYSIWLDNFTVCPIGIIEELNIGNDTILCEGESILLDASILIPNVYYRWNDSTTNATLTASSAGVYWVEVYNECTYLTDTIHVGMKTEPSIELGNDTTICIDESIGLDATFFESSYTWNNGSSNPEIIVESGGEYWVEVSNNCGIFYDTIVVELVDCSFLLTLPNAFSPNDDGVNDNLKLIHRNVNDNEFEINIFNRWGETVFNSKNIFFKWNGMYRNVIQPEDVYIYHIRAQCLLGNTIEKSGCLFLLR